MSSKQSAHHRQAPRSAKPTKRTELFAPVDTRPVRVVRTPAQKAALRQLFGIHD